MRHIWTRAWNQINRLCVWIGGGTLLLAALLVRLTSGSPYACLWRLGADRWIPPIWLMSILWLGWFFLLGCAWGCVLGARSSGCMRELWRLRGSMCLVVSVVLALAWYALLFGKLSVLFSWLTLAAAIAPGVLCVLCWLRVSRGAALVIIGYVLWLLFLFLLQLTVILHA